MGRYYISARSLLSAREYAKKCRLKPTQWMYVPEMPPQERSKRMKGIHTTPEYLLGSFTQTEVAHLTVSNALAAKLEQARDLNRKKEEQ